LEREIAKICRKVTKELVLEKDKRRVSILSRGLDKYLGVRRHRYGRVEENNRIGQVTGLAWTEVGGELLTIEVAVMPGQ
jgi:ATP-dependent Lon protease